MVAGHLREKSGYYYAVLNYTDSLGKRKTKWISTGLTVKGNKKRAEAILMDARRNFNPEEPKVMNGDILFADYMEKWLDIIKSSVAVPTFASYSTTVKKIVAPYFREKEVTLKNLTAKDIQEFYLSELERVSPSSVIHYHANIHKALKYAVKIDLIDVNPADKVERPKKDRYVGSFYDADEVNALFEAAKGSKLELPILFGAFYGLRRSEAIGLKWDAIDFDQNTITIRHTVTSCDLDGKRVLVASDTTKTKSSMRTLPLVPFMRERLLTLKEEQQEENQRGSEGEDKHRAESLLDTLRLVCAYVLRGEAGHAVSDGGEAGDGEGVELNCRGVTGDDGGGAEAVDHILNEQVADGDEALLKHAGDCDLAYICEGGSAEQPAAGNVHGFHAAQQQEQREQACGSLSDEGSPGGACDSHLERNYENAVEDNVADGASYEQV